MTFDLNGAEIGLLCAALGMAFEKSQAFRTILGPEAKPLYDKLGGLAWDMYVPSPERKAP